MVQPVQQNQPYTRISHLQQIWEDGGFALTVQLPPYLTADAGEIVQQVKAGASLFDAVLVADAPGGEVALSSMALAVLLKRESIETLVQFSGRDRNRLALQSDILGLGALGITDLLVDLRPLARAALGRNADARLVTDLDGPALFDTALRLRDEARFLSGASIKKPPALYIGIFTNLEAAFLPRELYRAQFVVTPPVDDVQSFCLLLDAFQRTHADFLQTRPLLVSLPLNQDPLAAPSTGSGEGRETGVGQIVASMKSLWACSGGIRGFNLVLSRQADLASLEQIVLQSDFHSVGRRGRSLGG